MIAERRAEEPVLPLKLLKNQVFVTAGIVALLLGFAMFGTITFLPLYLQVVRGASPTGSGLDLLPLMAGLLITSIVGGQIVSRTGRYRVFPIAGTAIMTLGLFLLSRLSPETSTLTDSAYMFVTGFGIGLVMQVLVVAVQNGVGYEELGVANRAIRCSATSAARSARRSSAPFFPRSSRAVSALISPMCPRPSSAPPTSTRPTWPAYRPWCMRLLDDSGPADGAIAPPPLSLSPSGTVVADHLIAAVRARLEDLLDGWSPEHYPELVHVLGQFASDIVPGAPAMSGSGAGPDSLGLGH